MLPQHKRCDFFREHFVFAKLEHFSIRLQVWNASPQQALLFLHVTFLVCETKAFQHSSSCVGMLPQHKLCEFSRTPFMLVETEAFQHSCSDFGMLPHTKVCDLFRKPLMFVKLKHLNIRLRFGMLVQHAACYFIGEPHLLVQLKPSNILSQVWNASTTQAL